MSGRFHNDRKRSRSMKLRSIAKKKARRLKLMLKSGTTGTKRGKLAQAREIS